MRDRCHLAALCDCFQGDSRAGNPLAVVKLYTPRVIRLLDHLGFI